MDRDEGEGVEKGVPDCRLRAWMRAGVIAPPATADFLRGPAMMYLITAGKKMDECADEYEETSAFAADI